MYRDTYNESPHQIHQIQGTSGGGIANTFSTNHISDQLVGVMAGVISQLLCIGVAYATSRDHVGV
jgi:hypothetical protein